VKVVDANVLVYAVNEDAPKHDESLTWFQGALSGRAGVGLSWVAILAFLRVSTRPGLLSSPLAPETAIDLVEEWLAQPAAHLLQPTAAHPRILGDLLAAVGTGGNLVNDAHLAALALEHRAEVVTYDTDFARFPGVRWSRPSV